MVPGSTFTYGSSFWKATRRPRDLKRRPSEAVVMPLPRPEATPPVTKMNFGCGFTTEPDGSRGVGRALAAAVGNLPEGCGTSAWRGAEAVEPSKRPHHVDRAG